MSDDAITAKRRLDSSIRLVSSVGALLSGLEGSRGSSMIRGLDMAAEAALCSRHMISTACLG